MQYLVFMIINKSFDYIYVFSTLSSRSIIDMKNVYFTLLEYLMVRFILFSRYISIEIDSEWNYKGIGRELFL